MRLSSDEVEVLYRIDKIEFFKNGLVISRKQRFPIEKPETNGKRKIYDMSRQSKMKLAHIIANCDVKFCSMLTLTYGDYTFPTDGRELKRQLNIFLNRLRDRFGCDYCWFLEFTKRHHPHVHMIITVIPSQFDRIWFGENWSEISVYDAYRRAEKAGNTLSGYGPGVMSDEDLLDECGKSFRFHKNPKNWEKIRKTDGATRYALKYAIKSKQKIVPPRYVNVGRFWGVSRGINAQPIGELLIGETMSEDQVNAILKNLPDYRFKLVPRYIFHNDALEFFQARGLKLTEIFGKFYPFELDEKENIAL